MLYEVHYPEEPEGPVWEADGTKWVPSEEWPEEWHRDDETPCDALSWKEVVAAYGPFTDTPPAPKAWNGVHKGALYWVEATRQGVEDPLRTLAYAVSPNTLIAMTPNRPTSITRELDNWELTAAEPMIAMPVSTTAALLSSCANDCRKAAEDRLNRDGQINWKLLDMPKYNG